MEITNLVREYAEGGKKDMSGKFREEGSEVYKEDFTEVAEPASPAE